MPLTDIGGQREEKLNFLEYAFVANNTQIHSRSEGEKVKTVPNTFREAMGLPEAKLWKCATEPAFELVRLVASPSTNTSSCSLARKVCGSVGMKASSDQGVGP